MFDKLMGYAMWIMGAIMGAIMIVAFCALMYRSGQHAAREALCAKVEGVYVQTYTSGWKCIYATVVDLK